MRSVVPMRLAKLGYIIISIAFCLLGIALILMPELSIAMLTTMCSIAFLLFGCVKLLGYYSKDLFRLAFQFDFEFGIVMLTLGLLLLTHPGTLPYLLPIAFGLALMGEGLFKVRVSIDAKHFGISQWWLCFLLAVLTTVFGLALVLHPGGASRALMQFLGASFFCEGCLSLVTVLTMVKIVTYQRPDGEETRKFRW